MSEKITMLSVSGGKDSTAMYLFAMRIGVEFRAVFADTGHEHDLTYDYVRELPKRTGGPEIQWVRADFTDRLAERRAKIRAEWLEKGVSDEAIARMEEKLQPTGNPFLDICLITLCFPSFRTQFCTKELKMLPIQKQILQPLLDAGNTVTEWHGVRRDESRRRACYERMDSKSWGKGSKYRVSIFRPILDWTIADVLAEHKRHGLKPNPLYAEGATRVGCAPCIYARKKEVAMFAKKFPDMIDKIREWEEIVNAARLAVRGSEDATFFHAYGHGGGHFDFRTHGIDAKVKIATRNDGQEKLPGIVEACSLPGYCE